MKKTLILAAATLLAGVASSSAAVTPQAWYHFADTANPQDSSGNARHFLSAYSHVPPNNPAYGGSFSGIITATGLGGPLGNSGYTSIACTRAGWYGTRICTTWGTGYNPPLTNFSIEISVQPYGKGFMGGSAWLFTSGRNNGSYLLRVKDNGDGTSSYVATIQGYGDIGSPMPIDTNRWTHLAMVNDNGVTTFYTNGVPCGPSDTNHATIASSGDMYIGNPDAWQGPDGLLDEARICTFAPGEFSTSDLLIKPPGPFIVSQPQNATVWAGGAVPFSVGAVIDPALTYQWRRNGANIAGATQAAIFIPLVAASDNGHTFACVVTSGSLSVTSVTATLTVVTPNAANVNAYRAAITSEPSLVAYFPVDGSTGTTVANTKDASRNGTLEAKATYEGRTNRAFGERALAFNADGEVQVPNHPAFDIGAGSGTVEAVIYMEAGATEDPSFLAVGWDGIAPYYSYGATRDGLNLVYKTDAPAQASWVTPSLIGRRAHIAFVVQDGINVTAYLDGQSLGTKPLANINYSMLAPAWIGAGSGTTVPMNRFAGAIDELSIYGSALSLSTIQTHYSKYLYGTNTAPPSIVSQPTSKTLLAGGSPVLRVQAAGTLPLSYQWSSNGVALPGATTATLSLPPTVVNQNSTYSLAVANAFGTTNIQPIVLTVVAPSSPYSTAVAGDRPTAYWRLGDLAGTTAMDSVGFNEATYFPTETLGVPSILPNETDTAVDFGTGSGRAQVANVPELNPTGPFTVEVWTKPNAGAGGIILSSQNRNNSRGGYSFHANIFIAQYGVDIGAPGATVYRFASTTVPAAGVPVHLVYTSDGVNGAFYLNGVLQASGAVGDFVNNVVAPLTIGKRSDNAAPWNGVVDEAAFYGYALSATQVSNHWSYIWSPAAITQQPAGVTTNEWATVSLTGAASGIPNTYQWQKNNVNLAPVNNPDGTAHYPGGVTSPTLVIAQAHPADNGQYRLVINNPVGGATSSPATVTITADTTKPTVNRIIGLGTPNGLGGPTPYLVRIDFSERVDSTTGAIPGNYVFNGGATAATVQVSADSTKAFVSTGGLTPGQKYSVTVSGVTDQAQTPNTIQTVTKTFWVPLLAQGLLWDFYPNVTPQAVDSLLINLYFPNAPYTNLGTATFDSTPITGGDLNNRPAFAGIGENYGSSLSGWITPTVTTNYYFYLASDDASRLLLSSSADPALAVPISEETGCCHGFQEPGNPTTSYAVPLLAGQSYFIRALQTEGGGGDYVKVAWKMEGDPTASTNLVPISGSVLRAYVPLAPPTFTSITKPGGQVVIAWTGFGILLESTDLKTWAPVPGNPTSPYSVTPSLPQKYFRVEQ